MCEPVWSSHLQTKFAKASHTFIIEDFLSKLEEHLADNGIRYESAKFTTPDPFDDSSHLEFKMVVIIWSTTPSQPANEKKATVSVSLTRCPEEIFAFRKIPVNPSKRRQTEGINGLIRGIKAFTQPYVPVICKFWILGESHKAIVKSKHYKGHYNGIGSPVDCDFIIDLKNIYEKPRGILRSDNSFAIRCFVEVDCGDHIVEGTKTPIHQNLLLNCRLSPESFPDMYLVGDEEIWFPCHKHMLAASSDIFLAIFSNAQYQESFTQEVFIKNIEAAALEKLLEFVYSDDIEDIEGYADQVIVVADKYNMINLKNFAMNCAVDALTIENVCNFLVLGENVQSQYLIQKASEFIFSHAQEVIKSDGWSKLSQDSLKLLFEGCINLRLM